MSSFPIPYSDELVYSAIARAGVRLGITSPKQLLDVIFNDRKVVATLDLPCHLQDIATLLMKTGRFNVTQLVYEHTLFPIYAPFVHESQRQKALSLMSSRSDGAVHLMLGIAAFKVKAVKEFRFCKKCLETQMQEHGEYYWNRRWFIPNLPCCHQHGALTLLNERSELHRHEFTPLLPEKFTVGHHGQAVSLDQRLVEIASQLLAIPPHPSPSPEQWTRFYSELAATHGHRRGNNVCHIEIFERVSTLFSSEYCQSKGLAISTTSETSWLRSIFRKHRRSFSFFEHLLVWQTFLPETKLSEILDEVRNISTLPKQSVSNRTTISVDSIETLNQYRALWSRVAQIHGVKAARYQANGGSLYAWLYRRDRDWLLAFNASQQTPRISRKEKVNWEKRDRLTTKALFRIFYEASENLELPRLSVNWFLKQLDQGNTIGKNLKNLPLTQSFLSRYAETITEYQLRRVCSVLVNAINSGNSLKNWEIMRKSGLSTQRVTPMAAEVLKELGLFETGK